MAASQATKNRKPQCCEARTIAPRPCAAFTRSKSTNSLRKIFSAKNTAPMMPRRAGRPSLSPKGGVAVVEACVIRGLYRVGGVCRSTNHLGDQRRRTAFCARLSESHHAEVIGSWSKVIHLVASQLRIL